MSKNKLTHLNDHLFVNLGSKETKDFIEAYVGCDLAEGLYVHAKEVSETTTYWYLGILRCYLERIKAGSFTFAKITRNL